MCSAKRILTQNFSNTLEHLDNVYNVQAVDKNFLTYDGTIRKWKAQNMEDLSIYDKGTFNLDFSCAIWNVSPVTITVTYYKSGNVIHLIIPAIQNLIKTDASILHDYITSTNLPTALIPYGTNPIIHIGTGINLDIHTKVIAIIATKIYIFNDDYTKDFTNNALVGGTYSGPDEINVSYVVKDSTLTPSWTISTPTFTPAASSTKYSTQNSLVRVNSSTSGLEEFSDCLVTTPAANQLNLQIGTKNVLFSSDCTINQNLSTASGVNFLSFRINSGLVMNDISNSTSLGISSDKLCTQYAIKNYVDGKISSSTNNAICRFNSTSYLQGSGVFIDDSNNITGVANITPTTLTLTNSITGISTDTTLASDSDSLLSTQHAIKTYVDNSIGSASSSFTITLAGIWASTHVATIYYSKVVNSVVFSIVSCTATANTAAVITSTEACPASLRPANQQTMIVRIQDNLAVSCGEFVLTSAGFLTITLIGGQSFSGAGVSGILQTSISYLLN